MIRTCPLASPQEHHLPFRGLPTRPADLGFLGASVRLSGPLLSLPCISGGLSDARAPEYAQSLPDTGGGAALPSGGTPLSGKAHLLGAYG